MGARGEIRRLVAALRLRTGAPISWRSGRGLALVLGHPPRPSEWQMRLQRRAPKSTKPAASSLSFWRVAVSLLHTLPPPPAYFLTYIPPARLPPQPGAPPTTFPATVFLALLVSGWGCHSLSSFACFLAFVWGEY